MAKRNKNDPYVPAKMDRREFAEFDEIARKKGRSKQKHASQILRGYVLLKKNRADKAAEFEQDIERELEKAQ